MAAVMSSPVTVTGAGLVQGLSYDSLELQGVVYFLSALLSENKTSELGPVTEVERKRCLLLN